MTDAWTTPKLHLLNVSLDTANSEGSGADGATKTGTILGPAPSPF